MSGNDVLALIDHFFAYMGFGLALYAGCALLATMWIWQKTPIHKPFLLQLVGTYGSVLMLIVIETTQQFGAFATAGHTSRLVLRIALPLLYLMLGNCAFRLAHEVLEEEFHLAMLNEADSNKAGAHSANF